MGFGIFLPEYKTDCKNPTHQLWAPTPDLYFLPPLLSFVGAGKAQVGLELLSPGLVSGGGA